MSATKNFEHISCEALHMSRQDWVLVDIRDAQSFAMAHVPGAIALNNQTVGDFLENTAAEQPVAVMCYHGHSSQQAAEYLVSQGIKKVASVDGGFEYWRVHFPIESA